MRNHFIYKYVPPGGRLNIKMSSYQYRDPHVKDKTVLRPSYLYHGNPHIWERRSLYWDGAQVPNSIEMSSYRYRQSHCGDKTVIRSSYLHNGISYTGKMASLYWIRAQTSVCGQNVSPGHQQMLAIIRGSASASPDTILTIRFIFLRLVIISIYFDSIMA